MAEQSLISCPSIDINYGLMDNSPDEGMVRACMLKQSRQNLLVVDHTKFSASTNFIFADSNARDVIVTDKKLTPKWERKCLEFDI
jgi:DeoR/GlpR family transcriptional regulator of sugar metabolism